MKRVSTATAFNPETGVVDASGIAGFQPYLVLAICNETAANRATLYDFLTPGAGITSRSGNLMTLEYDTSGMSSGDNIMIVWDDGQSVQSSLIPASIAAGLALLNGSQLAALAQALFASIPDVNQGGSIPAPGGMFFNASGFLVKSV